MLPTSPPSAPILLLLGVQARPPGGATAAIAATVVFIFDPTNATRGSTLSLIVRTWLRVKEEDVLLDTSTVVVLAATIFLLMSLFITEEECRSSFFLFFNAILFVVEGEWCIPSRG